MKSARTRARPSSTRSSAFDLCRRYLIAASRDHAIRSFYFLESKRRKVASEAVAPDEPQPEIPRKPNEPTPKPLQPTTVTAIGTKSQPKPAAAVTPNPTEAQDPAKIA